MHAFPAGPSFDPETPKPSVVQGDTGAYRDGASFYTTPSASFAANAGSQQWYPPSGPSQTQASVTSASTTGSSAFDIPMPDIQSVSVLPPRVQASTVADRSTVTSMADADRTLTHLTVDHADSSSALVAGGTLQIRTVTEEEYLSMPEYLRYQLTYQLMCDVVVAINHLTQHSRGG